MWTDANCDGMPNGTNDPLTAGGNAERDTSDSTFPLALADQCQPFNPNWAAYGTSECSSFSLDSRHGADSYTDGVFTGEGNAGMDGCSCPAPGAAFAFTGLSGVVPDADDGVSGDFSEEEETTCDECLTLSLGSMHGADSYTDGVFTGEGNAGMDGCSCPAPGAAFAFTGLSGVVPDADDGVSGDFSEEEETTCDECPTICLGSMHGTDDDSDGHLAHGASTGSPRPREAPAAKDPKIHKPLTRGPEHSLLRPNQKLGPREGQKLEDLDLTSKRRKV